MPKKVVKKAKPGKKTAKKSTREAHDEAVASVKKALSEAGWHTC